MQEPPSPNDLGLTFRVRKSGDVEMLYRGRLASTLRDAESATNC